MVQVRSRTPRRSEGSGAPGAASEALSAEKRAPSVSVGAQSAGGEWPFNSEGRPRSSASAAPPEPVVPPRAPAGTERPPRAPIAETAGPVRFAGKGVSCEAWAFPSKGGKKGKPGKPHHWRPRQTQGWQNRWLQLAGCIVRGDVAAAQQHVRDHQGLLHGRLEAHVWAINEYGYDPEYWQG